MFLLVCIALLLVTVVFLLLPWLRRARPNEVAAATLNKRLREEQIQDLDERLALGLIAAEDHAQMRLEIDKRLLEDVDGSVDTAEDESETPSWMLAALLGVVAAISIGLYFELGQHKEQELSQRFKAVFNTKTEDTVAALTVYEDISAYANPATQDNLEWLYMAAQGYMQLGHYRKASQTYDRMVAIAPNEAQLLADAAQAHYLANNRTITAISQDYLDRAFAINPRQQSGLGFAGMAAFEREDFVTAISYWQRAVDALAPAKREGNVLVGALAEAKRRAGLQQAPSVSAEVAVTPDATGVVRAINISLALGGGINASPDKTVFVLAKAKNGPPMPLAAKRIRVADLPIQLSLSVADAMAPAFTLASFDEVVVTARISQSGNAISQSGDIGSNAVDVVFGTEISAVDLVLDTLLP